MKNLVCWLAYLLFFPLLLAEASLSVETLSPNLTRIREEGAAEGGLVRYGILKSAKPTAVARIVGSTVPLAGENVTVEKVGDGYRLRFPLAAGELVYGLGDVSRANIQRRPGKYEIYVKNVHSYIPMPMFLTSKGRGVLVNTTWRNTIDVGAADTNAVVCTAKKSPIDFYVFTGRDYRELLDVYTQLTGRPALLPVFGYGFTYVCNQWIDQFGLMREAQDFRDRDLPCDTIGLEPGWMETFYDFRPDKMWDPQRFYFPYWCPKSSHTFISALGRMGFKLSLWLCCKYDLFRYEEELIGGKIVEQPVTESAKAEAPRVFYDERIEKAGMKIVDPRASHARQIYPKKTLPEGREPWFEHLKFFVDQGARCFKLDGSCQVTEWNGVPNRVWANGMDDDEAHNLYPLVYAKQMACGYENHTKRRAMVYSAGGYAGVQQYVATWAGDTGGGPKSLVSVLNLAASGHSNQSCDMDIYRKNPAGEALPRVVNAEGLHFGFLQPWSQQANWDYWEQPWYQPKEDLDIFRNYLQLRYRLLPYLYGAAATAARTGWPMTRPLVFMHPDVEDYAETSSTYYLGDDLIVSCYSETTMLPKGLWYDWWTGRTVEGGREVPVMRTRSVGGGLYVKAGAIVPMLPHGVQHVEKGWHETVELHVWTGADGAGEWYEDDGDSLAYRQGAYTVTPLVFLDGVLTVGARRGTFAGMPQTRHVRVVRHDASGEKIVAERDVGADGAVIPFEGDGSQVLQASERHGSLVKVETLPVACTPFEAVPGEAPSLLPAGRPFRLVWHDEFNGTALDESKWSYRTNFWGQRFPAFAAPEDGCVEVANGVVNLKVKKLPNGQFVSPQLQTGELMWDIPHVEKRAGFWPLPKREKAKFIHRYGYYECRCRLQRQPGWWSAFWMQSETQGVCLDPKRAGIEHDIMESFAPGCVGRHMFHMNGYGSDYYGYCAPRGGGGNAAKGIPSHSLDLSTDEFHTFGLLWEPDGYTVFVDGRRDGEKVGGRPDEPVSAVEEFLLISTECQWYRQNRMTGRPVAALEKAVQSGDAFTVDFVRVFDLVETDVKQHL